MATEIVVSCDKYDSSSADVFVVKGVGSHLRRTYLLRQEDKGPDVVIELTSESTREEDCSQEHELYERMLKVPEYFIYDPTQDYLDPPLQGYRLEEGHYVPLTAQGGRMRCEKLGLDLAIEGGNCVFTTSRPASDYPRQEKRRTCDDKRRRRDAMPRPKSKSSEAS